MRRAQLRPGRGFAASPAQREAVAGQACIVCGVEPCDPAHLISRAMGGCDDRLCVVPLDRRCHRDYDEHRLNLLPHLEPHWRPQLAHAVFHAGVMGALARIAGPSRGALNGAGEAYAPPARSWTASTDAGTTEPPSNVLSEREVLALLDACPERSTGIRNRALIATLWCCGPLVCEALELTPPDLNLADGTITAGREPRRRTLGVDQHTAALIACWIDCRQRLAIDDRAPVFCTLQGRPLDHRYLRRVLQRLGRKARLERPVRPPDLRRTYAFDLARGDAPIETIRDALGHSSRAITSRYLHRLNRSTPQIDDSRTNPN